MKPRLIWYGLLALVVIALPRPSNPRSLREVRSSSAPDVVLVTIDTLRADAVGFGGNRRGTTPNLDAMARQGRVFSNAHAQTVLTLPSHTNILTGLLPYQHGVRDNSGFRLSQRFSTAATLLKGCGYATAAFVAAFPLDSRFGLARGFDLYDEVYQQIDDPEEFRIPESRADAVVEAALSWYNESRKRPRLLWLHLYDPHAPYDPPSPCRERFRDDLYLGEIAFADAALKPLLDRLKSPDAPRTILIVTADHGESRGEHGELTHGLFAYESTLHVPLFLWMPGEIPPGTDRGPARHIDILPTILEAAGCAAPADLQGHSLLGSRRSLPREATYFESLSASLTRGWAPLRGLIAGRFKFIDLPIPELYDLVDDPSEKNNLASARPDIVRDEKKKLDALPSGSATPRAQAGETEARLRSLGYLTGGSSGHRSFGPEDDPKTLISADRDLHRVVELFQKRDAGAALNIARGVVERYPAMMMGYEQLAYLLEQSGDLNGALDVWRKAQAHGISNERSARRRALLLSETGRPEEAVKILSPYRESEDLETQNAIGIALSDAGSVDQGLEFFQKVLAVDPRNTQAWLNTGVAQLKADRSEEARAALSRALSLNARNARAWNALGVALLRLKKSADALEAWSRAIEHDPGQFDALFNIALVAAESGDQTRARDALRRFIAGAPPDRYGHDLARARQMLEEIELSSGN